MLTQALQLIEFLIANGSEQCIDDFRRHIYDVKGLENYRFVDDKAKDQGVNS
jgi:epsin